MTNGQTDGHANPRVALTPLFGLKNQLFYGQLSKHSALVSTSLSLISCWQIPVKEDSPLDALLTFFSVTV